MSTKAPTAVSGYSERLKASARHVENAKDAYKMALRQRNELIIEAVDHGYPQTRTARDAEVSQPHITRIMAASYDDLHDLIA